MKSLVLISVLLFSGMVSGQGRFTGKVTDSLSGKGLEYVNILDLKSGKGSTSGKDGSFQLNELEAGMHQIRFSFLGYESKTISIVIKDNSETTLEIRLSETSESLEEVVVSGTMKEVSKLESPIAVEVFSPSFFRKNPTPALFESLQIVNGVRPQINCSVCNTGDIHINGMEGPYTMILIDGMPIVSGLATVYGLNGIPSALVERIEIVKGPASTLYGSEAVGGLINVITRSPLNAPRISADVFGSGWGEINSDLGFRFNAGKHRSLLGINYFNYSNPIDNNKDGFTDLTLQDRISIFNRWCFARKSNKEFTLAARYVYEDRWGGQMNWNPAFREGDSIYGESIYTSRMELLGNFQFPVKENIRLTFSLSDHDQNSVYGTTSFDARQRIGFAQMHWNKRIRRHDLLSGIAARHTWYDDNTPAKRNIDSINKPSSNFLPGIFVQDEFHINEEQLLLAGLRYDYHSTHGSILSPRLNYKWNPNKKNVLRAGIGNGFRVVNIFTEDHAALTGSREVIITEELKPERSWKANLNFVHSIFRENFFGNIDISLFNSRFSNKIMADYQQNDQQIIYSNLAGHAISRGLSVNLEGNWKGMFKAQIGATLMEVFRIEGGQKHYQLLTERISGTFAISYIHSGSGFSIDYTGNLTGPMDLPLLQHDFRAPRSPWFSIQNIQVSKQFKKNWTIYGGVKNLLNFTPAAYSIMRSEDPFDKNSGDSHSNPFGYTFDTTYVYSSFQGIRAFLGLRYTLR